MITIITSIITIIKLYYAAPELAAVQALRRGGHADEQRRQLARAAVSSDSVYIYIYIYIYRELARGRFSPI